MTGQKKKLIQCCVLRGNKQSPEILVSLEMMKTLKIMHPTFGKQTIDEFLYQTEHTNMNKYSDLYNCNSIQFSNYTPPKTVLRDPSKEEKQLRENLIDRFSSQFVDKLGPEDRLSVPPIKLEVDKLKEEQTRPTNHIRPFDVPYHMREQFSQEIKDMLDAKIIERCERSTKWNTKAFPVAKADGTSVRLVGDWRGVNKILKKLHHHTESCDQLLRHIPADSRVFAVIDAASGYHQLRIHEDSQELLTIVTNMGRFTFRCLPQGINNSAALWNLMTDGDARIDDELHIVKNMDDWLLYGRNLQELEEKLVKFLKFAETKNLKLKKKKFVIGSELEFGGSILTVEKVKNEELIFIAPKSKRIQFFAELRKPQNKKDCQIFSGMLSSLAKWNPTVNLEIPLIRKETASKGKFMWNDEMDKEYETVRKTLLSQIRLTPYDPNKSLRLVIDASCTEGCGYVLFQFLDEMNPGEGSSIVSANCTRFKESQLRFSLIEAEAVALDFAISCCSYWISYCPQVELYSDASGLLDLLGKPLCDVENKRLQKILLRAQNFNFNPIHVGGLTNNIADCLSRLCGVISKTEHSPDDNLRLLPMSKKQKYIRRNLRLQTHKYKD